ncbi:hypothetical protein [Paraburkholderia sp. BR10923]|uniref:hypothetical protein n=1 Tax=Paraburkholderia TaxID=1822464 RepID=UPI0034CE2B8F
MTIVVLFADAAQDDYAAVVSSVTRGKCEMHPMLQEKKVQALAVGTHLDATDSIRCKGGGEVQVQYRATGAKFKVKGELWRVVGNPGAELQEDMMQQRQGRSAKYGPLPEKLPS